MKDFCENLYCDDPAYKEVPVSVDKPSDQVRTLCASCQEVYTWGVQHGRITAQSGRLWILAVADKGLVDYAQAYPSEEEATKGLVGYLRQYHGYKGPANRKAVEDWLDRDDEGLSVEIVRQNGVGEQSGHGRDKPILPHLSRFLEKESFIIVVRNDADPSRYGPFEAWAFEGPLDFGSAGAVTFGVGGDIHEALYALNAQSAISWADTGRVIRKGQRPPLPPRKIPARHGRTTACGAAGPITLSVDGGIAPPPEDSGEHPLFRVVYLIDVVAGDVREAAETAHRIMSDPGSQPPVLYVIDSAGNTATVDLSDDEESTPRI